MNEPLNPSPKSFHLREEKEFTVISFGDCIGHDTIKDLKSRAWNIVQSNRRAFVIDLANCARDAKTIANLIVVFTGIESIGGRICLRNGAWFRKWSCENLIGGAVYNECNADVEAVEFARAL